MLHIFIRIRLFLLVRLLISCFCANAISDGSLMDVSMLSWRGGATKTVKKSLSLNDNADMITTDNNDAYELLAKSVRKKLKSQEDGSLPEISDIVKAFKSLASAQKTFKGLDGAAHEAYQRTHHGDDVDISVSGRARRSAARAAATADGLGGCELCELWELPADQVQQLHDLPNSTLANRKVLLNVTDAVSVDGLNVSILVLYEAWYEGGAGVDHGGIDDAATSPSKGKRVSGRLLIVLGESGTPTLQKTLKLLHRAPTHVRLHKGLVASEAASVQPVLYKAAGLVLATLEPILRSHNETTAIHFTGRSLAGGVSAIAATILDGGLPMPGEKSTKKQTKLQKQGSARDDIARVVSAVNASESTLHSSNGTSTSLSGLGKGRTSGVTLGSPPCFSANVQSEFIISILYGDDIVCRSSKESLDRFLERTRRSLKQKWIIGRQMNWMSDTISLATSNLKSHAVGSEGEELRLATPGRAYLVRPRRLGHACSMHEVGTQLKGGREALRAAVLWQLNDVLLSKSLWKHHQLDSYISGLDRVHLRGLHEEEEDVESV